MKNLIKIVFSDLDGTLFRKDKTISKRNCDSMKLARSKGILWAVASARPERAISFYKELEDVDALITLNGARIKLRDKVISNGFSRENASRLIKTLLAHDDLIIVIETSEGIFGNIEILEWTTPKTDDLAGIADTCDVYKILAAGKDHQLDSVTLSRELFAETSVVEERVMNAIGSNDLDQDAYFSVAEGWLYQIMSRNATKRNGVELVLKTEGISIDEAVYFGDDNDDIASIKDAGLGVAMGNAIDKVREVADMVAPTNEEDGVAEVLEKLLG